MKVVNIDKLEHQSDSLAYRITFNTAPYNSKFFNAFAEILGMLKHKKFDFVHNAWLVDKDGYDMYSRLNDKIYPEKKKTVPDHQIVQVKKKEVSDWQDMGIGLKLAPYDYQKQVIKFIVDSHGEDSSHDTLIVSPCGSGKSVMLIGAFLQCHAAGLIEGPGMIVVKASLKVQWEKEVRKFSDLTPRIIKTYKDCVSKEEAMVKRREEKLDKVSGSEQKRLEEEIKELKGIIKRKFKEQFEGADLYILNYETLNDPKVQKAMLKIAPQFIGSDETQYAKSDSTKRSKSLCKFNQAKVKIGATATPVQRDPRDIFGIFKFVHPDLFPKKTNFNSLYVRYGYGYRVIGAKNEKQLNHKIDPYMFILTKEEVAKHLPKLLVTQRYCEFSDKQQEINDTMMEELDELNESLKAISKNMSEEQLKSNEKVLRLNAAISSRQTFLQELTLSDELLKESDSPMAQKMVTGSESPKIELMKELVSEIIDSGEKVIIFSRFAKMQSIITEAIHSVSELKDVKIAYIRGDLSSEDRYEEAYTKFRDDDDYKVMICSDAGAEGINASKCKYMIEMEPAVSYAIQTQRHGRLERADSIHDNVQVIQLITENSWDEIMLKSIAKKEKFDAQIVKGAPVESESANSKV